MAMMRRATCAVAALKPQPMARQPLTALRWLGGGPGARRGGSGGGRRRGGGRGRGRGRFVGLLAAAFVAGAGLYTYSTLSSGGGKGSKGGRGTATDAADGSEPPRPPRSVVIPKAEIAFETAPAASGTAGGGDIRDALSPQHRQVKSSLENPGVYAWGSNAGRVVAPDSADAVVKEPRRMRFFDGQLLRDLRLDRDVGVAVTERGDVLQWGVGFFGAQATAAAAARKAALAPVTTLAGKDIVKVALSNDRVIALAASGAVYSLPVAQADLQPTTATAAATPAPSSWWRKALWSSPSPTPSASTVGLRTMTPAGLAWGERVVDVCSGQEHCLLLTSKGRVFSAVSSLSSFPAKGQLGVPGLTWAARPPDRPLDAPLEVPGLAGIAAAQVAAGDYHSLVRARDGTLYSFGDNSTGQLGIPASPAFPSAAAPVRVPVDQLYAGGGGDGAGGTGGRRHGIVLAGAANDGRPLVRVTAIAAGGATSFFSVDVTETAGRRKGAVTADTWSCGSGIYGSLGTGKWVHISTTGPGKIRALSGLSEYSEAAGAVVPLRVARLVAGTTHAAAVLDNATRTAAASAAATATAARATDTNWGADTLWWGGNEHYQLGTGKRSNQSEPVHIAPLAAPEAAAPPPDLDLARARLALTPRATVRLAGSGRRVSLEQRLTCGRYVSAVYSGV